MAAIASCSPVPELALSKSQVALNSKLPSENFAYHCYAELGAKICSGILPEPANKKDLGRYTYRIKVANDPKSNLGVAALDSHKNNFVTITLDDSEIGQKPKTVNFEYEVVSEKGIALANKGSAHFTYKSAKTNEAPVLGINNISLFPNGVLEIRTINVTDVDSNDSDLRLYFDNDKLKNKKVVTSNGYSLEIKCGGEQGDVNPTKCQFQLLNPPLKTLSETFVVDLNARDIFKDAEGKDFGKSSETGKLTIKLSRDYLPMEAKDTACNFLLNQTIATCDIDGFAINDSLNDDVLVNVTNAATNGANDQIQCQKKLVGSNLKIVCSLSLKNDINTYPLTKDFLGDFTLTNTANTLLSMKNSRKISFKMTRELTTITKKQTYSTSSSAHYSGVDILWVVDNSQSMENNQISLAENFHKFIETFVPLKDKVRTTPFPFQMGVITTDTYKKTSAVPGDLCALMKCPNATTPYVLTDVLAKNDFETFMQNFTTAVKVGTEGSSSERPIASIKTFFDKNPTWSKPNNLLVMIMVSDENEQSYRVTPCDYIFGTNTSLCAAERIKFSIDQLSPLKAQRDFMKVFSIFNFVKDRDKVFETVSKEFKGNFFSIDNSFSTLLSQIGTSITDTYSEYTLSYQGTFKKILSVKLNGVVLPNANNESYEFIAPNKVKLS